MIKEEYSIYPKAFKEISEIIKFFPKDYYKKISKSFIDFIEENMDNNYTYVVEHIDDFQNQEMLDETKILLSIIYREFIASSDGKRQICKTEKMELLQEEKTNREKYNFDNIMKSKISKESDTQNNQHAQNNQLVEPKRIIDKIISIIKKIFNR